MPDSIRHPEVPRILFPGFRLFGRNDKSLGDNVKLASPEGEGFQPSPRGTLKKIMAPLGRSTSLPIGMSDAIGINDKAAAERLQIRYVV